MTDKPTTQEDAPPGQEPTIVVREPTAGPAVLPGVPMREGPSPGMPEWLAPHSHAMPEKRLKLHPADQVYFDHLWRRATGVDKPALSGRERAVLLSFLDVRAGK